MGDEQKAEKLALDTTCNLPLGQPTCRVCLAKLATPTATAREGGEE